MNESRRGVNAYFLISRPSLSGRAFDDDELVSLLVFFSPPSLQFHNKKKSVTKHLCLASKTFIFCLTYSVHSSSSSIKTSKEEAVAAGVLTIGF